MTTVPTNAQKGFSLIEMSIVLAVVGLLLAGIVTGATQFVENSRVLRTKSDLETIKEAIVGYAISEGRLPCPAQVTCDDTRYKSDGVEQVGAGASCGSSAADLWGTVPFSTLGVEAKDIWGNYYMYRISESFGNDIDIGTSGEIVIHSSHNTSADNLIANNVAAVLLSPGLNRGQSSSSDEAENFAGDCAVPPPALITDTVFVSKEYVPAGSAAEFDDVVLWISPYTIKARLGQAGRFSN